MGQIYLNSIPYAGGTTAQNIKLHKYTATITSSQYGWFTFVDENGNNLALSGICTPLMASCISSSNYYISGLIAYDENDCYIFKVYDINDSGYTHGYIGTSLTLTFELAYLEVIPTDIFGNYSHYSTSERAVGTWVDGSTIYEKTIIFPSKITLTRGSWTSVSAVSLAGNEDIFISTKAFLPSHKSWMSFAGKNDSGTFKIFSETAFDIKGVIIQYTKAST